MYKHHTIMIVRNISAKFYDKIVIQREGITTLRIFISPNFLDCSEVRSANPPILFYY